MKVAGLAEDTSPLNIENLNLPKNTISNYSFWKIIQP